MKKETFDFSEALRRMKEGKKVRRIGWGIVDKLWIDKDKNINIFYKATPFRTVPSSNFKVFDGSDDVTL